MSLSLSASMKITRYIHWFFAIIIIAMLSVGFYMKNTDYNPDTYQLHKTVGVILAVFVILRLYWRIKYPWPSVANGSAKEQVVVSFHLLLILAMILMPITGFMLSALSGFGIHLFGYFIVPENIGSNGDVVPFNNAIYQVSKTLHEAIAYAFSTLIVLHFLAALKHHFIDKDDTLRRMRL